MKAGTKAPTSAIDNLTDTASMCKYTLAADQYNNVVIILLWPFTD